MNLYHWSSETLADYSNGDIIVMAESVEKARDKVYEMYEPLEDGNPFEDCYLQLMDNNNDEDLMSEYKNKLNVLRKDLDKEPSILSNGVALISGGG